MGAHVLPTGAHRASRLTADNEPASNGSIGNGPIRNGPSKQRSPEAAVPASNGPSKQRARNTNARCISALERWQNFPELRSLGRVFACAKLAWKSIVSHNARSLAIHLKFLSARTSQSRRFLPVRQDFLAHPGPRSANATRNYLPQWLPKSPRPFAFQPPGLAPTAPWRHPRRARGRSGHRNVRSPISHSLSQYMVFCIKIFMQSNTLHDSIRIRRPNGNQARQQAATRQCSPPQRYSTTSRSATARPAATRRNDLPKPPCMLARQEKEWAMDEIRSKIK